MKYALIIGNDSYTDPKLAQLKTPAADSRALANVLGDENIGGFDEVIPLINQTETEIRRAISSFFEGKRPDDLVLLYFSGHGVLDNNGRLFLASKDTQTSILRGTATPSAFIADEMDNCRSKRQILILDCCHSGAFARGIKAGEQKAVTAATFEGNGYGRVVLTASDATQYALEGDQVIPQTELSLFTYFLLEGLQTGKADTDNDGFVSLDEWYDYTYTNVLATTPRQVPHKWSYRQRGDLLVAKNPHYDLMQRQRTELAAYEEAERFRQEQEKRERDILELERTIRERLERESAEKAQFERSQQRAARMAVLKETFSTSFASLRSVLSKLVPVLRIIGFAGVAIVLFWIIGSWGVYQFRSLVPIATASLTSMLRPSSTLTLSPQPSTKTLTPTPTSTKTPPTDTLSPTVLSAEIIDAKGVSMRLVPAGEFTMGYSAENANRFCQTIKNNIINYGPPCSTDDYLREEPVHAVYLSNFFMDVFEVSNEEYKKCVADNVCDQPSSNGANRYSHYYDNENFHDYPVLNVTWNMAKIYCEWRGGRLPTEAEWEKAARGTDELTHPWGTFNTTDALYNPVFYEGRANINVGTFDKPTVPVTSNSKGLSPYQLYNMAGNVAEWIADWYGETYYETSLYENPLGPSSGVYKVIRGGSVNTYEARTTARDFRRPSDYESSIGIRCAMDIP